MTKEELIEMIDATINENGSRSITGKALNLALTEIVNAMGSGSGAGAATIYCMMGEETEEQKAHNATVWAQLKATVEAGQPLPPILIDVTDLTAAQQGMTGVSINCPAFQQGFDTTGAMGMLGEGVPCLLVMTADFGNIIVAEDGSITSMGEMSTMSLRR
jgi:hypothetical protein